METSKKLHKILSNYADTLLSGNGFDRADYHLELCKYLIRQYNIDISTGLFHRATKEWFDNISLPKRYISFRYTDDVIENKKKREALTNILKKKTDIGVKAFIKKRAKYET